MGLNLQPVKALNAQEQATYFHARERRRSLAGIPELFRTHLIRDTLDLPVANIVASTFPVRDSEVTLRTAIRVDNNVLARAGLIFEFGSSTAGIALWLENQAIGLRAGATANDGVAATFNNGVQWPALIELDIVAAVRPGLGLIGLWLNGNSVLRAQSVSLGFTNDEWAASSAGSFASAAQGTIPADVAQTGAPSNFAVIEPLSVYIGSRPRQFITPE